MLLSACISLVFFAWAIIGHHQFDIPPRASFFSSVNDYFLPSGKEVVRPPVRNHHGQKKIVPHYTHCKAAIAIFDVQSC